MKQEIIALGEILIDFTPVKDTNGKVRFEQNAGGAPANVLAAVAKLGMKTGFVGCVGADQFGDFLIGFLKSCDIDCSDVKVSSKYKTTLAFVHLKEDGDRDFSFYRHPGADLMIAEEDVTEAMFQGPKVFHFGSLSMTDEPARSATLKAIRLAKDNGCMISYDPNLRPKLWRSLEEAKDRILSVMCDVDILKISEEELLFLTGKSDVEKGSRLLYDLFKIPLILVTLGANGCAVRQSTSYDLVDGIKVEAVDTTGAGDSHLGAMLYQMVQVNKKISDIPFESLLKFAEFANYMAAYVTMRYGSAEIMPTYNQVAAAIEKGSWM